jgi:ZIP family zinc transporter
MDLSRAELGFILVCGAGSATGLGAAVVFSERLVKLASKRFLAGALGLSAGVMLYVSFAEILVKSQLAFEASSAMGAGDAYMAVTASLFAGMAFMALLDVVVHALDPRHDERAATLACGAGLDDPAFARVDAGALASKPPGPDRSLENGGAEFAETDGKDGGAAADDQLHRMGVMTALAIGIHNFPEGLATFVATLDDPAVGGALAVAIAIHNVPEGLCVSIPIYFATGDRWLAFRWALLSGVSEPIGALLGWLVLKDHFNELLYGIVFGMVAGMMVMICLNELFPTAHRYDPADKVVTKATVAGMAVMAASLCLFVYS